MAFKRTSSVTAAPESIIWITDYSASLSKGLRKSFDFSKHEVSSIVFPKSGKGYVLNISGKFATFVWRNSTDGKAIGEFINGEIKEMPLILVNLSIKSEFEFGFDDERKAIADPVLENKWQVIPDSDITNRQSISPIVP
jgi:hypothetical protein